MAQRKLKQLGLLKEINRRTKKKNYKNLYFYGKQYKSNVVKTSYKY